MGLPSDSVTTNLPVYLFIYVCMCVCLYTDGLAPNFPYLQDLPLSLLEPHPLRNQVNKQFNHFNRFFILMDLFYCMPYARVTNQGPERYSIPYKASCASDILLSEA